MRNESQAILHETANLYLNRSMEVCLNGATHSVVVGTVQTIEQAKRFMDRAERHIEALREMFDHPA